MNLRDLEYLLALEELGHFGKAARKCFVSQPTLSGQIKKLEEELGLQLLERSRKGLIFSEAGQKVVERAHRILEGVQEIEELARSYRDPMAGSLRLGVIPTVAPYLLPLLVEPLKKAFPDLKLYLSETQTSLILERLASGSLDLGILALPIGADGVEEKILYEESFLLTLPEGHALAQSKTVPTESLQNLKVLLLDEGHCFRDQALELCQRYDSEDIDDFRGTSMETLRHMVLLGHGITLVPELTARFWEEGGGSRGIRNIPFAAPFPSRGIGLIHRKNSPRQKLFDAIGEVVLREVSPLLVQGKHEVFPVNSL